MTHPTFIQAIYLRTCQYAEYSGHEWINLNKFTGLERMHLYLLKGHEQINASVLIYVSSFRT